MYTIKLSGTTGPEPDIAKVHVFKNGVQAAEIAAGPLTSFSTTVTSPGSETLQIGYSFVDTSGNESAQHTQSVVVPAPPDTTAPASPTIPLTIVSMVWA